MVNVFYEAVSLAAETAFSCNLMHLIYVKQL